jgi:hypothetical protein
MGPSELAAVGSMQVNPQVWCGERRQRADETVWTGWWIVAPDALHYARDVSQK